jgi:hypothetical protein
MPAFAPSSIGGLSFAPVRMASSHFLRVRELPVVPRSDTGSRWNTQSSDLGVLCRFFDQLLVLARIVESTAEGDSPRSGEGHFRVFA